MEVILLEKVQNLGNLGDKVKVSPGYGRNYLIPGGHALPATGKNLETFEVRRAGLEAQAAEKLQAAKARADVLSTVHITIEANMSDEGKLYGSIGTSEIVTAMQAAGHEVAKKEVLLPEGPIHYAGDSDVQLSLHSDVLATVKVTVVSAQAN